MKMRIITKIMYVEILVPIALFSAAALQAAGGMGFGLVASPLLVTLLGSIAGIQAAIILNLIVAAILWVLGHKEIKYQLLIPMIPGLVVGMLIGVLTVIVMPQWLLKMALCIALGWVCFAPIAADQPRKKMLHKFSFTAGIMGGALAIPGPAAAAYLQSVTSKAHTVRSSMMPLLVFVYLGIGIGLFIINGIDNVAITAAKNATLIVVLGLLVGFLASNYLSNDTLKRLAKVIMVSTLICLIATTTSDMVNIGFSTA